MKTPQICHAYMYVCMYVCMCVCMYFIGMSPKTTNIYNVCINVCMYVCMYVPACLPASVSMHGCIFIYTECYTNPSIYNPYIEEYQLEHDYSGTKGSLNCNHIWLFLNFGNWFITLIRYEAVYTSDDSHQCKLYQNTLA